MGLSKNIRGGIKNGTNETKVNTNFTHSKFRD